MSGAGRGRDVQILIVDDDEVDVLLLERALRRSGIDNPVVRARDGQEALDLLRGAGPEPSPAWPCLVLLDINMPRMNGHEFLAAVRSDADLSDLTIFVLTTSEDNDDIKASYDRHVAGYLVKSGAADGVFKTAEMLGKFLDQVSFHEKCLVT
ncbi:MAG: response regulator [Pseudomonadota bacterium]